MLCFYQIASGLQAMHVKGIVDQDIHPGNLLCSQDGTTWKKADLGSSSRNRVDGKPNVVDAKDCQ